MPKCRNAETPKYRLSGVIGFFSGMEGGADWRGGILVSIANPQTFSRNHKTPSKPRMIPSKNIQLAAAIFIGFASPTSLCFSQGTTELTISAGYIAYIKAAANSGKHGQGKDGRFYPYLTPQGYRIGYRQTLSDKALHARGWSVEEADTALLLQLKSIESELRQQLQQEGKNFDEMPLASREILLDYGFTEGVAKLKPEWIQAVTQLEWERILNPDFYVRYDLDWPDTARNKAFFERWNKKGGK
jgi:hypothetical protein